MGGEGREAERPPAGDEADQLPAGAETERTPSRADDETMPAFLRYGIFTVGVYVVAIGLLVSSPSVDVQGPSLVAFTVGFSLFMTVYFGSMWVGWLFLD